MINKKYVKVRQFRTWRFSCRSALLVIGMLNGVIEPSPCPSRRGSQKERTIEDTAKNKCSEVVKEVKKALAIILVEAQILLNYEIGLSDCISRYK
ncbi:MAG: hypothetical protein GH144_06060, partial [Clostridia bacterium]|nr:hypothetical protein [Clostridia bacterium]